MSLRRAELSEHRLTAVRDHVAVHRESLAPSVRGGEKPLESAKGTSTEASARA
jgi:hypothetical protein